MERERCQQLEQPVQSAILFSIKEKNKGKGKQVQWIISSPYRERKRERKSIIITSKVRKRDHKSGD
jgi:hypothetical protein